MTYFENPTLSEKQGSWMKFPTMQRHASGRGSAPEDVQQSPVALRLTRMPLARPLPLKGAYKWIEVPAVLPGEAPDVDAIATTTAVRAAPSVAARLIEGPTSDTLGPPAGPRHGGRSPLACSLTHPRAPAIVRAGPHRLAA
jgi:hypothetical protein